MTQKHLMLNNDKLVIFDWGGVILNEYSDVNNLQQVIIRTIKKYNQTLSDDEAFNIYQETLLDEKGINISTQNDEKSKLNWVKRIAKKAKVDIPYEDFINTCSIECQKASSYSDVVKYIYSLKDKCKVGLLSNIIFTYYDALNNQIDLSKLDYVWLSYQIHQRKPDVEAFIKVENDIDILPKNILFIDDKMRNLNVAKSRGWNICCANGNELEKIKDTVEKFLGGNEL